jgi:hypothetical protein
MCKRVAPVVDQLRVPTVWYSFKGASGSVPPSPRRLSQGRVEARRHGFPARTLQCAAIIAASQG